MGDIETRLFRYFIAVAEERSFSRAAVRLGITPPTLTHQIQKLESLIDARLINRRANTLVELTEAGRRVLVHARSILRQTENAIQSARQACRGEIGRIEVGYILLASCAGVLQERIGDFQRSHPAIDMQLNHLSSIRQIQSILRHELDVGFMRPPLRYPAGLSGFTVHREPLVVLLPATHRLAGSNKPINPAELKNEVFVNASFEIDLAFRRYLESVVTLADAPPNVSKRTEDMFTTMTYISLGYGIAIVPRHACRITLPNLVFREIALSPPPEGVLAFVHRVEESDPAKLALIRRMQAHEVAAPC